MLTVLFSAPRNSAFGFDPKVVCVVHLPENNTVSITIYLSSNLGVRPRRVLDAVKNMVERGKAEYLVIGGRPVGSRPFRLVSSSESWNKIYSRGELAKATISISLEEYV